MTQRDGSDGARSRRSSSVMCLLATRVTTPGASNEDSEIATDIMRELVAIEAGRSDGRLTPAVAVELARMLAHIAGDGRGVYEVVHRRQGDGLDRTPPAYRTLSGAVSSGTEGAPAQIVLRFIRPGTPPNFHDVDEIEGSVDVAELIALIR